MSKRCIVGTRKTQRRTAYSSSKQRMNSFLYWIWCIEVHLWWLNFLIDLFCLFCLSVRLHIVQIVTNLISDRIFYFIPISLFLIVYNFNAIQISPSVTILIVFFYFLFVYTRMWKIINFCRNCFSHRLILVNSPPKHWNTGLVSSEVSLTSWGEEASLALADHPHSDGSTIKSAFLGRCFITLTSLALHLFVLVETKSDFFVRSLETDLGRWALVVAVISVNAYLLLSFSDLTCHLEDTEIGVFCLHCATWY